MLRNWIKSSLEPSQKPESRVEEDDTPLDIQAIFAPIWEALS